MGGVKVSFGESTVYPGVVSPQLLEDVSQHMAGDEVRLGMDLGIADGKFTAYGCDLTEGYIRLNADYTT